MNNLWKGFAAMIAACVLVSSASADSIRLHVDSAPNVYGSPHYAGWRDAAFAAASTGTFVNMENSKNAAFAGTTKFQAEDALVYSSGDLGQRLHFVYFIENTTKAQLMNNLEVRMSFDWDNTVYYDFGSPNFVAANFANLVEINGGVAGTFGNAFWPTATDAPDTSAFDSADIAAVADQMYAYQTFWKGEVRVRDSSGQWSTATLRADLTPNVVPLPAAMPAGLALVGLVFAKRKFFKTKAA